MKVFTIFLLFSNLICFSQVDSTHFKQPIQQHDYFDSFKTNADYGFIDLIGLDLTSILKNDQKIFGQSKISVDQSSKQFYKIILNPCELIYNCYVIRVYIFDRNICIERYAVFMSKQGQYLKQEYIEEEKYEL